MHKKDTNLKHSKLANDLLNYINENIQSDINIDELSFEMGISKHHLHKIFKEQMGANIYEIIKSIRLQKASNLLITNKYSTITEVANLCGYSSQTSFIRAFKQRFNQTPKEWRKEGYKQYSNQILSTSEITSISTADFSHLEAKIVKSKKRQVYYIRQNGYNKNTFALWQKMLAWVYTNDIKNYNQIGIYHDNPVITPLENCHYVACIEVLDDRELKNTSLPTFDIPDVICARFEIEGKYGDILKIIQWVYHVWLPDSGFETTTIPSYTVFEKNHFLSDDKLFKGYYFVPIRYV
jgi:AraC family transcriptional regulator